MFRTIRQFSHTAACAKPGYSTVQPVHHLVKVEKSALMPKYSNVRLPKSDIESVGYRPTEIDHDRLRDHYTNTLQSDMLLHFYEHGATRIVGEKKREWGTDSPYKLYRNKKRARITGRARKDILPITHKNVPELESITVHSYNKNALEESWLNISTRLQLAQITNVKPKQLYAKSNILPWKLREGKPCGAKVELTGLDMSQFVSTLTELVLPRIRAFRGIKMSLGDSNGNVSFGLDSEDLKYFPEIENFQDLFPNLNGIHVTFKTSARTDEQARTLLSLMGFPFTRE